jgi:hypothetical protein
MEISRWCKPPVVIMMRRESAPEGRWKECRAYDAKQPGPLTLMGSSWQLSRLGREICAIEGMFAAASTEWGGGC